MKSLIRMMCLAMMFTAAGQVQAGVMAALDFSSSGFNGTSINSTRGYVFNITSPVTVTGLSVFDDLANGLGQSHDVGLWNSSGTLLASAIVPSGTAAPLDDSGKFRYVMLGSSITLSVGDGYRVGATMAVGGDTQWINPVGLATAPGVVYVSGALINNASTTLTFPSSNLFSGLSGGSFVIGSTAATVPEPTSCAIWGIGALGMGLFVRRKK